MRLVSCSGVLLFVTQPAIDSRWVHTEALFADSLAKPIIPIQLEPSQLRHGMRLLLGQYQFLNGNALDFPEELDRSLRRILPAPVLHGRMGVAPGRRIQENAGYG